MSDLISRQAAIDATNRADYTGLAVEDVKKVTDEVVKELKRLPSTQPERLTDDFETIRIHLNAYKEKLCNQQRWEEAEEYQRIIDRFMAFASAQPEIIRCGQCKYAEAADSEDNQDGYTCQFHRGSIWFSGSYCSWAERREECTP